MKPVLKLLNSYYFRGIFGPFFVIVFPIIMLFIMSNAMESAANSVPDANGIINPKAYMSKIIAGIMITSLISNGLIGFPTTIIEFKTSTLIKRIGAAHISKRSFFAAVILYQLAWSFFSVIWVLFWGGIFIGSKSGYDWSVAFNSNFGIALPFILLTLVVSLSFGLLIISFFKTQTGATGVANLLFMPISFLSGSLVPKQQIDNSSVLSGISYVLPTKYAIDPYFASFINGKQGLIDMGWQAWGFPLIAIAFVIVCVFIGLKKFKWGD